MDKDVEEVVKECTLCGKSDTIVKTNTQLLQPVRYPAGPWLKVAIDIMGPFDIIGHHNRFVVVMVWD